VFNSFSFHCDHLWTWNWVPSKKLGVRHITTLVIIMGILEEGGPIIICSQNLFHYDLSCKVAFVEPIMKFIQKTWGFTLSNGLSHNIILSLEVKLVIYYQVISTFMHISCSHHLCGYNWKLHAIQILNDFLVFFRRSFCIDGHYYCIRKSSCFKTSSIPSYALVRPSTLPCRLFRQWTMSMSNSSIKNNHWTSRWLELDLLTK